MNFLLEEWGKLALLYHGGRVLGLVAFFLFIPQPNNCLRCFGQKPGCSGTVLWEWREGSMTPCPDVEVFPPKQGTEGTYRHLLLAVANLVISIQVHSHSELPHGPQAFIAGCSCTSQAVRFTCCSPVLWLRGLEVRRLGNEDTWKWGDLDTERLLLVCADAAEHRCCRCYLARSRAEHRICSEICVHVSAKYKHLWWFWWLQKRVCNPNASLIGLSLEFAFRWSSLMG